MIVLTFYHTRSYTCTGHVVTHRRRFRSQYKTGLPANFYATVSMKTFWDRSIGRDSFLVSLVYISRTRITPEKLNLSTRKVFERRNLGGQDTFALVHDSCDMLLGLSVILSAVERKQGLDISKKVSLTVERRPDL